MILARLRFQEEGVGKQIVALTLQNGGDGPHAV